MPDTRSIVIVKQFTFRGLPEEFSNKYHFKEGTYNTLAEWKTLADAIILAEKPTVPASVSFVAAYGYEAGTDHSVAQINYRNAPNVVVNGTLAGTGAIPCSGDVAATIRWATGLLNSKGKQIFCRKYMHGVAHDPSDGDKLYTVQLAAMNTFGNKMVDGTLPQGVKYCAPQGAGLGGAQTNPFLTTRTLKRRGKRP